MSILYNCKSEGARWRITKFDDSMNVESSYITDGKTCDCPAGKRPMCRHREMLPKFQYRDAVDSDWFFDYDRGGWVQMELGEPEPITATEIGGRIAAMEMPTHSIAEALVNQTFDALTSQHSSAVEHGNHNPSVEGSNPSAATKPSWRRF